MATFPHDPDAGLDYEINWVDWLGDGETLTYAVAEVDDAPDDALVIESQQHLGGVHTVWISGGTPGRRYRVRSRVTTSQGRVDDRTIVLQVTHR